MATANTIPATHHRDGFPGGKILAILVGSAVYLAIAIWGRGGPAAFFAHAPLTALALVTVAVTIVSLFAGGNLNPGIREDRANRWVLRAFSLIGLAIAWLPAYTDLHNIWVIGGDGIRWAGVVIYTIGCALRIWPVFVLGNRFSGLVAIQPGHRLATTGIYSIIRHPSYLGALTYTLGWGLAFHSIAGVLLTACLLIPLLARIRSEEKMLQSEFGAEYEAFRLRTPWRLIPGLW